MISTTTRIATITSLHPKFRPIATGIYEDLKRLHQAGKMEFAFEVFETLRLPARQEDAFARKTSKARAWESAHNVGLAADFVPYLTAAQARKYTAKGSSPLPGWYWPAVDHPDWITLADIAEIKYGMQTISWDRPHVEHPLFDKIQKIGF